MIVPQFHGWSWHMIDGVCCVYVDFEAEGLFSGFDRA